MIHVGKVPPSELIASNVIFLEGAGVNVTETVLVAESYSCANYSDKMSFLVDAALN